MNYDWEYKSYWQLVIGLGSKCEMRVLEVLTQKKPEFRT